MNGHEYRFLLADREALKDLLAETPAEDVIDRLSLERRLGQVEAELENLQDSFSRTVNARLTFGGRPVRHRSLQADFGSRAVQAFAKAVAHMGASQLDPLAAKGPVPNRQNYELAITRIVQGSFGFELEAVDAHTPLPETVHPVKQAIRQIQAILEASANSDADEQLAQVISATDPRARESVRAFLQVVADHEAVCALELDGRKFQFRAPEQVRHSLQRLSYPV